MLIYLYILVSGFLTCRFFISSYGKKNKITYYLIYILGSRITSYFINILVDAMEILPTYFDFTCHVLITYLFCRYILKVENKSSLTMGFLSASIWTSLNVFNFSFSSILARLTSLNQMVIVIIVPIVSIIMLAFFYHIFANRYGSNGKYGGKHITIFIVPITFLSLVSYTILDIAYMPLHLSEKPMVGNASLQKDFEILALSMGAIVCIYIILYTYDKVITQMKAKNNAIRLETENQIQRRYIFEAKNKYDSTKTFRHDFKNHIITLNGLLNKNEIIMAKEYLSRFEEISESMNFDIYTNNTIIDILLGEKLALADKMKIDITCNVEIEEKIQIDDFDLCTVFSNAIDNAIKACADVSDANKFIDIFAKRKNDFFVIDIINSYNPKKYIKGDGIGLETIRLLTEKYGGTIKTEDKNSVFRLSVLFTLNN